MRIEMLRGMVTPPLYNAHSAVNRRHISNLYNAAKAQFPLSQNESRLVNNVLIHLFHDNVWKSKLCHRGIPPYFIGNSEFRANFVKYIDSEKNLKFYIRQNLATLQQINGFGINSDDSCGSKVSEVTQKIIEIVEDYTREQVPQLLLASHGIVHLADLCRPQDEFVEARRIRRKIIAHIGPTNSGKTYQAFNALTRSKHGIYCSPLRLLAWEIHRKLLDENVSCGLSTGQESQESPKDTHLSCTVEMTPLDRNYDCAVIDEMQLVGDANRGFAWTRAFLGLKSPEIHVCGSASCLGIATALANICGDVLHTNYCKRLGKISVLDKALKISDLRPGDCVVVFSRQTAIEVYNLIESKLFKNSGANSPAKTGLIYGSMPPESRKLQIDKFNSRTTLVLVASDVIGMGVNVKISRIIFHTLTKYDGYQRRLLNASEVQQIAGRAGRYSLDCGSGSVSCLNEKDLVTLKLLMKSNIEEIEHAYISPSPAVLASFVDATVKVLGTKYCLVEAIKLFASMVKCGSVFKLTNLDGMSAMAKVLSGITLPSTTLVEYLLVPLDSQHLMGLVTRAFATSHMLFNKVLLRNILVDDVFDVNNNALNADIDELQRNELLYQILDAYAWLSYKFPQVYQDAQAVIEFKATIVKRIECIVANLRQVQPETSPHNSHAEIDDDLKHFKGIIRPQFI